MSIRLSSKHGVNPAIPVCFFCGKDKNEIILAGHLKGDIEAPRKAVWDKKPCDECESYMKQGVMLVSVKDGTDHENPYKTGNIVVIKVEAAEKIFNESIKGKRFAFVEDFAWDKIGLPRQEIK
jgi:hypothetical protein